MYLQTPPKLPKHPGIGLHGFGAHLPLPPPLGAHLGAPVAPVPGAPGGTGGAAVTGGGGAGAGAGIHPTPLSALTAAARSPASLPGLHHHHHHPAAASPLGGAGGAGGAPGGPGGAGAGTNPGGPGGPGAGAGGGGGGGGGPGPIRRRISDKAPMPMTNGKILGTLQAFQL